VCQERLRERERSFADNQEVTEGEIEQRNASIYHHDLCVGSAGSNEGNESNEAIKDR
jgi:hypothetical protein